MKRTEKQKRPISYLLRIPLQLVISIALFCLGSWLDMALFTPDPGSEVQGHGIPFFTVIFLLLGAVLFVIVTISSVIKAVKAGRKR